MKKIFVAIVCFVIFVNFSVCQAKIVRVADEGAENLYQNISQFFGTNSNPMILGNLHRVAGKDFSVMNQRAFECQFGNYSQPFGEIVFYVDSAGYVSDILLHVNFNTDITSSDITKLTGTMFYCLGLSATEAKTLYFEMQTDAETGLTFSKVWSPLRNKLFVMYKFEEASECTYTLHADDGKD